MYPQFPGIRVCSHMIRYLAGCIGLIRKRLPHSDSTHLFVKEAFRCLSIKFQGKTPLGPWMDNLQAMPSYLAVFTPHTFICPSKWKCAFLQ